MAANDSKAVNVGGLRRFLANLEGRFAANSIATTSSNGLMSAGDKSKLDSLGALTLAYDEQGGTSYISLVEEGE